MKKVIITKDNYEEVMFNLLENEYPKDVRENLLDQIHADTFLSFEWKQWSKAQYSEGIETYKRDEAEFIESLIKEDSDRKGFWITMYRPLSIAASLIILLGVSIVIFNSTNNDAVTTTITNITTPNQETPLSAPKQELNNSNTIVSKERIDISQKHPKASKDLLVNASEYVAIKVDSVINTVTPQLPIVEVMPVVEKTILANENSKRSKYRISIAESSMVDDMPSLASISEHRYTMADVLRQKDGITLSKFLDNAKSKIVEDKTNHITYIEYIAADMSVLVVPLSN